MPTLQVSVAGPRHLETLLPMMRNFNAAEGIDVQPQVLSQALNRLLADVSLGVVALFQQGSPVVGYGVLTWGYDLEFAGRDSFITELYLCPEIRGCGLGHEALRFMIEIARSHSAGAVHLGVRPGNAAALRLYQRAGFADAPRRFMTLVF